MKEDNDKLSGIKYLSTEPHVQSVLPEEGHFVPGSLSSLSPNYTICLIKNKSHKKILVPPTSCNMQLLLTDNLKYLLFYLFIYFIKGPGSNSSLLCVDSNDNFNNF